MTIEQKIFKREYERLKSIFTDGDKKKLDLLEGEIVENARLRCQLDKLNKIIAVSGIIKTHPANPLLQKELPVAKELTRVRASYLASCKLLCRELGGTDDEINDDLDDFE